MNKKRIIFYFLILSISLIIFLQYNSNKNIEIKVKEYETFPKKEVLENLEELKIQ